MSFLPLSSYKKSACEVPPKEKSIIFLLSHGKIKKIILKNENLNGQKLSDEKFDAQTSK